MSQKPNYENDEIDLSELLAGLFSHKLLIALFTALSIFVAGNFLLTAKKKFMVNAIFQIEESDGGPGFNIRSGELGSLASLAGISAGKTSSSSEILIERVTKREFIIDMKQKLSFERDNYFNSYDPNYKDPIWKEFINKILGWHKTDAEKNAIIESKILESFRKNVIFGITDGGAIVISVTHTDPEKASYYANNLMEEIRQLVERESIAAQDLRLSYLSETLADALQEMDETQENLKNYALKNSVVARENFFSDSLKLNQIRMEKRKVAEIADLLSVIEEFLRSGNVDNNSYEALRSSHPLVNDIYFRRILGMSETISAWTWPEIETVDAVRMTLRDRIKRLDVDIKNLEEKAKIYATSADGLSKFTRDAKIAEATYTVLIEQVKAQTLAAGFQPETFKVYEYATPPLTPFSPKRFSVLAIGAIIGMLIGCALAVINSMRRGVYYSKSALISNVNADLAVKARFIRRLSQKSISDIISTLSKRSIAALDEADLKLSNKKIIYILNSGGQPTASNAARLLAVQSAQSGRNVVLCDTSGQSQKEIKEKSTETRSTLPIEIISENISVLSVVNGASFFTSKTFNSTIKSLEDSFDQVFVCASDKNSQLGLMALLEFVPGLVTISRLGKTKKSDIKRIKTRQPVDLLIYD